jgi:ATP adenylyltransferase
MEYLENHRATAECIFCQAQALPDGPDNLIAYRAPLAYIILNRFPYTTGHLMVAPFAHIEALEALEPAARAEMMELAALSVSALRRVYAPAAFNLGVNIGEAAGAGVKGHIHMHVVPRWVGDTSFMSAIGQTRVLPETLVDTFRRLHAALRA